MEKSFNPWKHLDNFSSVRFDDKSNELEQWPIKLWQVPAVTPFFHGAHLLVAADCSAFAYPSFHDSLSRGKIPVICCPAQDYDIVSKLSDILAMNDIKSITVAKMEAECCADLESMVREAAKLSRLPIPIQISNLFTSMQAMKNEMYFNMKQLPIRRSIAVLSAMLQQVQIQRLDEESSRADFGQIIPNRLWKLGRTEDTKLFDRIQRKENSAFVVDILLDSSSSQNLRQPQIAAQGYIISQSLSLAGIPHRVHSFCSYWDYTMLHCFRDYDDGPESNKNILQFRAFGENRDGLAIRTVCDSLKERSEENKILIILSDGRPNNLGSMRPGTRKPTPYVGEEAIKDTAFEIRKARNQGIRVLGIFVGNEEDLYAEKKIFGKEFTYTKNISSFAHIVGRYLRRLMEQDM